MNRSDLITTLTERTGLQPAQARSVVEAMFGGGADAGLIATALAAGDAVRLTGFGTFEARQRAARRAMNPKTGRDVLVPAAVRPIFRAGNQFKQAVQAAGGHDARQAAAAGRETREPATARAR